MCRSFKELRKSKRSNKGTKKHFRSSKTLLSKVKPILLQGTTNSHNAEQDTCHWESTCYEKLLRFNISLREIFLKSSSLRVIKNMMKVLSYRFIRVWDLLTCWLSKGILKRCFLESGLRTSFTACNFRNKVAMTMNFFFKMFKI